MNKQAVNTTFFVQVKSLQDGMARGDEPMSDATGSELARDTASNHSIMVGSQQQSPDDEWHTFLER